MILCMPVWLLHISLQPDPNAKPNLNPIQTDPPKFIKEVKNGKLYSVGSGEDMIYLVHVWGMSWALYSFSKREYSIHTIYIYIYIYISSMSHWTLLRHSIWNGLCTWWTYAGESQEHDGWCVELPGESSGMFYIILYTVFKWRAWLLHPSQVEAINGTIDIFPKWFLDDVANVG